MPEQKPTPKKCFVIGPIGSDGTPTRTHADWLYDGIIIPTFEEKLPDWIITRSDKIASPGMIDSQIINLLISTDLVVADMSILNANAFYEMGIRHMTQKPIIHVFIDGSEIPFDVKPYRAIQYSIGSFNSLMKARAELSLALKEATAPDHEVENPVSRAIGKANFNKTATDAEKLLASEISSMSVRISEIEQLLVTNKPKNRTFLRSSASQQIDKNSIVSVPKMAVIEFKNIDNLGFDLINKKIEDIMKDLREFTHVVTTSFANEILIIKLQVRHDYVDRMRDYFFNLDVMDGSIGTFTISDWNPEPW